MVVYAEDGHRVTQSLRLLRQRLGRGRGLLDKCGVLLGHFIHPGNGRIDLSDTGALLLGSRCDLTHDVRGAPGCLHDFSHGPARVFNELRSGINASDRFGDQILDLLRGSGTALCKRADFSRDDGKPSPLLAGTGGLDRRIERENVGLERNPLDHADDLGNPPGAFGDLVHRRDNTANLFPSPSRDARACTGQLARLNRIVCVLAHGAGQLFHARCGLLQRGGLLFGPL